MTLIAKKMLLFMEKSSITVIKATITRKPSNYHPIG